MFEPNYRLTVAGLPFPVPVRVFIRKGIKTERVWEIHTQESWDKGHGARWALLKRSDKVVEGTYRSPETGNIDYYGNMTKESIKNMSLERI